MIFISLTVVRIWFTVVLKEPFSLWRSNYFLSEATALRDLILCSAWKKWIRNPKTHPSSLWSPDLASCDFWAFPTKKRELRGKKTACSTILLELAANGLQHVLEKGVERCKKCIACQGGTSKKRPSPHLHKVPTRSNKVSPRNFQTTLAFICKDKTRKRILNCMKIAHCQIYA
jgi:hypothetical protein